VGDASRATSSSDDADTHNPRRNGPQLAHIQASLQVPSGGPLSQRGSSADGVEADETEDLREKAYRQFKAALQERFETAVQERLEADARTEDQEAQIEERPPETSSGGAGEDTSDSENVASEETATEETIEKEPRPMFSFLEKA